MREDEQYACERFEAYVRERLPTAEIEWEEGEDPPDCYLQIDGRRFAVEITTIVDYVVVGTETIPRHSVETNRERLVEEIDNEAHSRGIASGKYYIGFPPLPPGVDFMSRRRQIKEAILDTVKRSGAEPPGFSQVISFDGRDYCVVAKAHNDEDRIAYGAISTEYGKWEGEIEEQARDLLQGVIDQKTEQLEGTSAPKILLVLHRYPYVDPVDYHRLVPDVEGLDEFDTVCIIGAQAVEVLRTRSLAL